MGAPASPVDRLPGGGHVVQLLGPSAGGIRRHVAFLAERLTALGWRSTVAGPAGVLAGVGRQDADVDVTMDPRRLARSRRRLAAIVGDADVVHAHGLKAGWLAASLRRRPPLVVTVHNLVLDEAAGRMAPALRALEGRLPSRADAVVAVSADAARRFSGAPHADRVEVIAPAGPEPVPRRARAEVRAALGVGDDDPLVVTVARLHPQKDLPTLLDAALVARRLVPELTWVVVGEGPLETELRRRATDLGLDATVRFVGASPYAVDELAAADVFALSSRWEGSPLVVAEALQVGTPVVATAVGAIPEVVVDGVTGRLVASGDAAALGAAVAEVLSDQAAAARLAAAGKRAATARFGTEALIARVAAVYERVAARP